MDVATSALDARGSRSERGDLFLFLRRPSTLKMAFYLDFASNPLDDRPLTAALRRSSTEEY